MVFIGISGGIISILYNTAITALITRIILI